MTRFLLFHQLTDTTRISKAEIVVIAAALGLGIVDSFYHKG